jgi:4-amino-4-deoxy-L-arabinose transferase-like glycosyltransferase
MKRHASIRDSALPIAAIVALLVAVVAPRLPHLSTGPLDWDEGVYWMSMRSMRAGNALFTSVYSSQPPAFLLITEPPWAWLGGSIAAGRAVMLAWSVVGVGAGAVLGWRLGGRVIGVATAGLLTIDPRMIDQSITLQADGPATSLALLSLAAAALAITLRSRRWSEVAAVVAGAVMVLGILTKLFDVAVVPSLALVLLSGQRRRALLGLAAAGGLAVAALVLLPNVNAWSAMWSDAIGLHLATRAIDPGITVSYLTQFLHSEWPIVALAALGVVIGWRRGRPAWMVGLVWVAGAMGALLATRPVFPHHMVLVIPGLAILGGTGVASAVMEVCDHLDGRGRLVAGSLFVAVAAVAGALLMRHALTPLTVPTDSALVARLQTLMPPSALLLGDDQFEQALAARDAPPQLVDTSGVRLGAESLTAPRLESMLLHDPRVCGVLFGAGRLSSVPGFVAWVAVNYPVRNGLPAGAVLYMRPVCQP